MDQIYLYNLIKPDIDIKIIGSSNCGKTVLTDNILTILNKKYLISPARIYFDAHNNNSKIEKVYAYTSYGKRFYILEYSSNYEPTSRSQPPGHISFVNTEYINKKTLLRKYNNLLSDGEINYSSPHTFFIASLRKPLQLCETEIDTTYLTKYSENPFCYYNVRNLVFNIKNRHSLYNDENGKLYGELQSRLKELDDKICHIKLCMKHVNDNLWLPSELNLVIINMFIYL